MDPDQTLKDILALANAVQDAVAEEDHGFDLAGAADELATNIIELDHWLRKVGFLPAAWATGRKS